MHYAQAQSYEFTTSKNEVPSHIQLFGVNQHEVRFGAVQSGIIFLVGKM